MTSPAAAAVPALRVLVAAGLAAALGAQQDFADAYARFVAAPADDAPRAAAAASDRFLALAPGPARDARLAEAVHATRVAGRLSLALELADEARRGGRASAFLVEQHLRALLEGGTFPAFVDRARDDVAAAPAAVHRVLLGHEARVLPLAERLLRSGDAARGRFVFAELARAEPRAPWRLGNLALCLRQLGDVAAARAVHDEARAAWPDDLELANDYGLFLRAQHDLAGARAAFERSHALDLARPPAERARGPAITNLVHLQLVHPELHATDPLPAARRALQARPDAAMLARLTLDLALDRLAPAVRRP